MATTEDRASSAGDDEWKRELYDADARARRASSSRRSPGSRTSRSTRPSASSVDYERDLGYPGVYPFTRGVYPSMYRGRLWTMRQFAGFGTAEETNERFRYLLEHGQTGLSTAFDMPTLMGYDSDHPRSLGEVGREGVAVDSLADMETLFAGIPLGEVSTSMTINAPGGDAARVLRLRRRAAGRRRAPSCAGRSRRTSSRSTSRRRSGSSRPSRRCGSSTDMVEFCAREMPRWHPISISGYHIREAGSTAAAGARVHARRRLRLRRARRSSAASTSTTFAPRLSLLLQRAPRLLRGDRQVPRRAPDLGARAARALRREEPALVADALPHADRRRLADRAAARGEHRPHRARGARRRARRHAVAAHELVRRGARAADRGRGPDRAAHAAGDRARDRRREHDRPARRLVLRRGADEPARGRGLRLLRRGSRSSAASSPAIEENFFQREIAEASFRYQAEVEAKQRIVVGVNRYQLEDEAEIEILRIDPALEQKQIERVAGACARGATRRAVERTLAALKEAAAREDAT